jgi:hypothetical protein
MKSRDALIRLKRFDVEEKRRKVADIEAMIGEFNHMAVDLDRQIAIEQERAGISDVNHYAYPTFAKAALQRRNNLTASARTLPRSSRWPRPISTRLRRSSRKSSFRGAGRRAARYSRQLEVLGAHRVAS